MTSKLLDFKSTKLSTAIASVLLLAASAISTTASADSGLKITEDYLLGADNNRIFYRELGKEQGQDKQTIIYLHGGPGFDLNDGGYELDPLAEKYRVIVYDQRGGGYSEKIDDPANLSAERHVEDLEAIRKHFKIEKFTLMGQSWGSGLGMLYADKYPQNLDRLILLSPMPIREAMWNYRFTQTGKLLTPEQNQAFFEAATADLTNATPEEVIANCRIYIPLIFVPYLSEVSDWANMKGDYCNSDIEGMKRRWSNNAATMASVAGFDWREIATQYQGPTYILDGEWSMVPLNTTREWGAYLPNSKVEILKHSGHLVWLDNPTALFDSVETFMTGEWPTNSVELDPTELDLLALYSFDGSFENSMDNRFDATSVGNVTFGQSSAYFDKKDDQLSVNQPDWGAEPKNWTWAGWLNIDTEANADRNIFNQGGTAALNIAQGKLAFTVGGVTVTDSVEVTADSWFHVTVVQDGDSVRLYRDGQLVAQGSGADLPSLQGDFTMQNWKGELDDVRIYSGSLNQARINQVYQRASR